MTPVVQPCAVARPVGGRSVFEHPSLSIPVTEEQRDRTIAYLQDAFATGRITSAEFEQRVEMVLRSQTRRELNQTLTGLAVVPMAATRGPLLNQQASGRTGRGLAGVAHLSGLVSWVIGPALVYGLASEGSYARHEAAKAFNFQATVAVIGLAGGLLLDGFLGGVFSAALAMTWFVLTLASGARALQGENWRTPISRVVPLRLLDEGPRAGERPRQLGR